MRRWYALCERVGLDDQWADFIALATMIYAPLFLLAVFA